MIVEFALMKGAFPCKAFSCCCRSVSWGSSTWGCASTTLSALLQDGLMEECFFGGWGWSWKGSVSKAVSQRNLTHSPNSLLDNLLQSNVFQSEFVTAQQGFFSNSWKLGALHPFSQSFKLCFLPLFIPLPHSFQPYVPWKCAIDRSLSAETSLHRLAICLCFISPTKRWARMRDLSVLPSSFSTSTRLMKLV